MTFSSSAYVSKSPLGQFMTRSRISEIGLSDVNRSGIDLPLLIVFIHSSDQRSFRYIPGSSSSRDCAIRARILLQSSSVCPSIAHHRTPMDLHHFFYHVRRLFFWSFRSKFRGNADHHEVFGCNCRRIDVQQQPCHSSRRESTRAWR